MRGGHAGRTPEAGGERAVSAAETSTRPVLSAAEASTRPVGAPRCARLSPTDCAPICHCGWQLDGSTSPFWARRYLASHLLAEHDMDLPAAPPWCPEAPT